MHGEQEINEPLVDQQKVEEQSSADIAALQAEFQRQQQQQQQRDSFVPLRGDEIPAFAVDDGEIFQIKSRWTSVGVADVYDVKIVNVQHFDDEAEVKQSGLFVGKKKIGRKGMLKSADLSFSFRLPYRVNKDELSVSVTDAPFEVLSSFVTEIQFGIINENSQEGHFVESASVDEDSIQTATVTIPLVRDLSQSIPVFDQINYHGQHVLHKTIEIKGFDLKKQKPITYYIRTKIIEAEGKAEITSVTTSYIDAVRVAENWASFKLACTNAAVWTRNLFSGCKCGRKKSTTDSDTALEAGGASPSGPAPVPQLTYVSSSPTASMAFQPPVAAAAGAKVVVPSAAGAAPQLMTPMRIHGSDQVVLVPISAAQAAHLSPSSFVVMNNSS